MLTLPPRTFADAKALLDAFGLPFSALLEVEGERPNRYEVERPLFKSVGFGLTPEDWVQVASLSGDDYLGGCCGLLSGVQDQICAWFRFDPEQVRVSELQEVADAMGRHDGSESPFVNFPWDKIDAGVPNPLWKLDRWERMALAWAIVRDHADAGLQDTHKLAVRQDLEPLDQALGQVSDLARALSFHRMFHRRDEGFLASQEGALDVLHVGQVLPPLRILLAGLEAAAQPLEGLAMVDLTQDGAVCTNGVGLTLFLDEKSMREMFTAWLRSERRRKDLRQDYVPIAERVGWRRMRIDPRQDPVLVLHGPIERFDPATFPDDEVKTEGGGCGE